MTELLDLLRDAVRHCLDADNRNVGITASGGLDSSTVACLAAEQGTYRVFTGYYDGHGFDERQWSRLLPGDRFEVQVTAQDFVDEFDRLAAALRPPWQGPGCFGQWMVARYMAGLGVEVALSGEGADELFGGYARILQVAGVELPDGYPDSFRPPTGYPDRLEDALAWEMRHLDDLLATDARILGAWGIESRSPFTTPQVEAYALELPARARVDKIALRRAVRGILPAPILGRTDKMGFPAPLVAWAQEEPLRGFLLDRLGYLPDVELPWSRDWWYDLLDRSSPEWCGDSVWTTTRGGVA